MISWSFTNQTRLAPSDVYLQSPTSSFLKGHKIKLKKKAKRESSSLLQQWHNVHKRLFIVIKSYLEVIPKMSHLIVTDKKNQEPPVNHQYSPVRPH